MHPLIVFLAGVLCGGFIGSFSMACLMVASQDRRPEPIDEQSWRHDP